MIEKILRREFFDKCCSNPYSKEQIAVWLRGLLTIAWADGNFDPQEQNLINSLNLGTPEIF